MKIGIPKEVNEGETRVAVIPPMISLLTKDGHQVLVEAGAGASASFSDKDYSNAGASITREVKELYRSSDLILKVWPPGRDETEYMKEGSVFIGFMAPLSSPDIVRSFADRNVTSFSMEFIPRITRAQSMDALSSMASLAGYKAVLIGANHLGKIFPLMMTAAGTITPATVLVLGAGVAGLQAIATAKRLGAKVEAFDPRPVVKEQVESLGAHFIEMEIPEETETAGGYAKAMSDEFIRKEHEAISARLSKADVVITTALIFGKGAPLLITGEMVKEMRAGSVIVDLAAAQGGNCELTEADKIVEKAGIKIVGTANLPALLPVHASQMYSKNITNLFRHIFKPEGDGPDYDDDIVKGACITHSGRIVNEMVKNTVEGEGV